MKTVVVGLSGGVDSSVAAYLLKEQGYNVIGIFMKNWHDESVTISDECPWIDDSQDALLVAQKLGIPFQTLDLSESYKERIVNYMFKEYEEGRTPNPDILCNREIKFDLFLTEALKLGADFVATGHYCRKRRSDSGSFELLAGKDPNKDQSYFLCQLTQEQLSKALFPIGELEKPEVRRIAQEADLITAEKKDSQGLCFIGKVKLPVFLQQQLQPKEGKIIEIDNQHPQLAAYREIGKTKDYESLSKPFDFKEADGKVVGNHEGAHYFTIGQRKGLRVGGSPLPLFVVETNVHDNIVYVGQGDQHTALNKKALKINTQDIHWINQNDQMEIGEKRNYLVRIRYRQPLQNAELIRKEDGIYILFDEAQSGVSPGQFACWYLDEQVVGSGVIA